MIDRVGGIVRSMHKGLFSAAAIVVTFANDAPYWRDSAGQASGRPL